MLSLQQRNLLPLQTGQKVQYQQGKSTVFFVTVSFSQGSSMFDNGSIISPGTVRGCFDASFALDGST